MMPLLFPCFSMVHDPWVCSECCFCHHLGSSMLIIANSVLSQEISIILHVPKISMIPLWRKWLSFKEGSNKCGPPHCLRTRHNRAWGTWLSQMSETVCMIKAKGGASWERCAEMDHCTLSCLPASTFCRWGCQTWKSTYFHAFRGFRVPPFFYHCICIMNTIFLLNS